MKTGFVDEAVQFERVIGGALNKAGGLQLLYRAEAGESVGAEIADLLGRSGVWDVRARAAELDAEVAAVVCRAAGRVALPYPVAERLAGDPDAGIDAVAVVAEHGARVNLFLPDLRWAVSDGGSAHAPVTGAGAPLGTKLGTLVSEVETGEWVSDDDLAPLALTLPCWYLLGMCEAAFELTRRHLLDRHQFGRPLASFQALQFRMADTASALQGFTELARYTIWSIGTAQPGRLGDALALRLAALETAEQLFRTCHQLHGAMGFCDEVPLSWLSRYSQPIRRLPWSRSETEQRLLRCIETVPFASLYTGIDDDTLLVP